jgi:hypothetical protein
LDSPLRAHLLFCWFGRRCPKRGIQLRLTRLRLWLMGSRLLDDLVFFAFGGGIVGLPVVLGFGWVFLLPSRRLLSVCLRCWVFLDLAFVLFLDLDFVPFLDLLVVY